MPKSNLREHLSRVEEVGDGSWAISYGDMVTLLLSFFVLFFSIDFKKFADKKIDDSLKDAFKGSTIVTINKNDELKKLEDSQIGTVQISDGTFLMFFKETSFFNSGSTELTKAGKDKLKYFYDRFLPLAGKYKVKAHSYTDSVNVRKIPARIFKDNLELSTLRSLNIVRRLNLLGLPSRRLEITGRGEMSKRIKDLLELNKFNEKKKNAYSRTISLIVVRDEDLK